MFICAFVPHAFVHQATQLATMTQCHWNVISQRDNKLTAHQSSSMHFSHLHRILLWLAAMTRLWYGTQRRGTDLTLLGFIMRALRPSKNTRSAQGTRRLLGITGQPVRDDKPSESDKGKRNRPPLQKRPNKGVPAAAAQWVGALFTAASASAITGSQPIGFTSSWTRSTAGKEGDIWQSKGSLSGF